MKRPPKKDEMIRDAVACASAFLGDGYRSRYGNYLEAHYAELLPKTAGAVWLPLKQYVVSAAHLRTVTAIPKAFHFPVMVLELAALSNRLAPADFKGHPYYIGLRAIWLAIYKLEIEPFMGVMKPEDRGRVTERLRVLDYKYPIN